MFFFLRLLLHPVKEMLEMQEQGAKQERMLVSTPLITSTQKDVLMTELCTALALHTAPRTENP